MTQLLEDGHAVMLIVLQDSRVNYFGVCYGANLKRSCVSSATTDVFLKELNPMEIARPHLSFHVRRIKTLQMA